MWIFICLAPAVIFLLFCVFYDFPALERRDRRYKRLVNSCTARCDEHLELVTSIRANLLRHQHSLDRIMFKEAMQKLMKAQNYLSSKRAYSLKIWDAVPFFSRRTEKLLELMYSLDVVHTDLLEMRHQWLEKTTDQSSVPSVRNSSKA